MVERKAGQSLASHHNNVVQRHPRIIALESSLAIGDSSIRLGKATYIPPSKYFACKRIFMQTSNSEKKRRRELTIKITICKT